MPLLLCSLSFLQIFAPFGKQPTSADACAMVDATSLISSANGKAAHPQKRLWHGMDNVQVDPLEPRPPDPCEPAECMVIAE